MVLLILISSTGVYVDGHFCQGKLKSIAFFTKAPGCAGMLQNTESCAVETDSQPRVSKKQCCVNHSVYAKHLLEAKTRHKVELGSKLAFLTNFLYAFDNVFVTQTNNWSYTTANDYIPPEAQSAVGYHILYRVLRI